MFSKAALTSFSLIAVAFGQQIGTETAEVHPTLTWEKCTTAGGCTTQQGSIVLDANWRWVHDVGGYTNCYTGNEWNATLCPDDATCATNCALDGADYSATYGISTSGDALTLNFVTDNSNGDNVGSRVYLMASDTEYELFMPNNQEFTFDVDVSNLPCGLNGAVYFSQMSADGGMSAYPSNKAGAQYGTGYCDSQCPQDLKFINGMGNVEGWTAEANSANSGTGMYGSCCTEMDIWEANSISTAFTPHPCTVQGQTICTGEECAITNRYGGYCDPDGCDFNTYRMGNTTFYGPDMTVDTTQKMTVVTQFITSDNTSSGTLSQINRIYVQNGKVIQNAYATLPTLTTYNSVTTDFCTAQKTLTNNTNSFQEKGGMAAMSTSFNTGVVLVLSLWDDYAVDMLWLDSDYPTNASTSSPGVARGTCATTSGVPATIEVSDASASVVYSNIKFGDIGSTYTSTTTTGGGGGGTTTPPTKPTTTSPPAATQTLYGQCGGIGYAGPTACVSGATCTELNTYYSQCLA
jgi:cellulose 1,4-beta-cellobiosidase